MFAWRDGRGLDGGQGCRDEFLCVAVSLPGGRGCGCDRNRSLATGRARASPGLVDATWRLPADCGRSRPRWIACPALSRWASMMSKFSGMSGRWRGVSCLQEHRIVGRLSEDRVDTVWQATFALLKKLVPIVAKWGPTVITIIKNDKYTEVLEKLLRLLSSSRADDRLRGRLQLTLLVAQKVGDEADDVATKELGAAWVKRLNNLSSKLDLPVVGRRAAKERRTAVQNRLTELGNEMGLYLGQAGSEQKAASSS